MTIAGFAVVAVIGTLVRWQAGSRLNPLSAIPLGTLTVNVAGSFLLGALIGSESDPWLTIAGTAGVGALTTFSTFAVEVDTMRREPNPTLAVAYTTLTLTTCLTAAALGQIVAG